MTATQEEKQKLLRRLEEIEKNENLQISKFKSNLKKSFASDIKSLNELCCFQAKGTVNATLIYKNNITFDPFIDGNMNDHPGPVVYLSDEVVVAVKLPKNYKLKDFISDNYNYDVGIDIRDICPENNAQWKELMHAVKQIKQKLKVFAQENNVAMDEAWEAFIELWY